LQPPDAEGREKGSEEHAADWATAGVAVRFLIGWLLWVAL